MTEFCDWKPGKKSNDHGWAFGVAQWHLCYREQPWLLENKLVKVVHGRCVALVPITTIRDKFFASHPEMTTWQGQAKRYLTEIRDCSQKKTVTACVDSWNAGPTYMNDVYAMKPLARSLLAL